jgi:hypothetical protein
MSIIHTHIKKSKKRKMTAKQRELKSSWEAMLKKYETKTTVRKDQSLSSTYSLGKPACRETPKIPSLPFTGGVCAKRENPVYTGSAIKGIGTMHKSNAIPIFSDEQAVEIATMRRG